MRAELREMRARNPRRLDAAEALLRPEDQWRIEQLRLEAGILWRYLRQEDDGRCLRVLGT